MSKNNSMELLPKEIEIKLPKMYETEKIECSKKILHVRYISIFSDWEWYLCEYDRTSKTAFGFVKGMEDEWGYFSIKEIEEINAENLRIIRDESFTPRQFGELNM